MRHAAKPLLMELNRMGGLDIGGLSDKYLGWLVGFED